jgi:hypothetical protein
MLGIWRLVIITESRAGTYPTLDPSWYGGGPIVLAALEIDLAAMCASLPVFWPVLKSNLGWIFVTREVSVTRELRRYSTQDEDAELCDVAPGLPSDASSQPTKRYSDIFIRWQVDPLKDSQASKVVVESGARTNGPGGRELSNNGFTRIEKDNMYS